MSVHGAPFEGAGCAYRIAAWSLDGDVIVVEDYWDRLIGRSWMDSNDNPAAINYALRVGVTGLPRDDEAVYGKVNGFGHIVHVSELGPVVESGAR